jgi:ribosomal protein S18 acetylase RimI-like enzyme
MTSPTLTVRRLTEGDWEALRATRLAGLTEAPWAFASTVERELGFTEEIWRERLTTGPVAHFGADQPGHGPREPLAGLIGLLRLDGGWHVVSMWVSPQARGTGLAGELVTAACDLAKVEGAPEVDLWVTLVNERARAFYRKAGFGATGEQQPVWPDEPDHLEERMVRPL